MAAVGDHLDKTIGYRRIWFAEEFGLDNTDVPTPDHPVYRDAIDALRQYLEAKESGAPANEVERLRLIADAQIKAASAYQLDSMGYQPIDRQ